MSEEGTNVENYSLIDAFTGKVVRTFNTTKATGKMGGMKSTYRLNFSDFTEPGTYYLKAGKAVSPRFPINAQVYNGTADYLLHYMRQQRCGYNPFLKDSCHVHDGYIVYHPTKTGQHIDVRGGWHDATDYLQYTTTSANAIYQMMFAYQENPESFGDAYDAAGHHTRVLCKQNLDKVLLLDFIQVDFHTAFHIGKAHFKQCSDKTTGRNIMSGKN